MQSASPNGYLYGYGNSIGQLFSQSKFNSVDSDNLCVQILTCGSYCATGNTYAGVKVLRLHLSATTTWVVCL